MNDLKKRIWKLKNNLCSNTNATPLSYWTLVESTVKEFVINSNYIGKRPSIDNHLDAIRIWKEIISKPDRVAISPNKIYKLRKFLFVDSKFSKDEMKQIETLYNLRNQYAHTLKEEKNDYDVKPVFLLIQKIIEKSDEITGGMKNEY